MDYLTTHTSLSPIRRGFAPGFVNYKKGCNGLAATSDKVYQLLAHDQLPEFTLVLIRSSRHLNSPLVLIRSSRHMNSTLVSSGARSLVLCDIVCHFVPLLTFLLPLCYLQNILKPPKINKMKNQLFTNCET